MDKKHEVLQILQEECAEVIRAASKVIRFGEDENLAHLEEELGDLQAMIDLLQHFDMISFTNIDQYAALKVQKLKKFSRIYE